MDGVQTAGSSAPSPAKGKTGTHKKSTTKGVSKKTGRKNATTSKKVTNRPKGRGRNKTYEDQRVQAAYDRQKDLRDLYSEVANAIKPVLEDLADMSVKNLTENPTAHKEVSEYQTLQRALDDRLEEVLSSAQQEFENRTTIATNEYNLSNEVSVKKFHNSYDRVTEDFLDACINRVELLLELEKEGLDIDSPDTTYAYVEKPNEVIEEQGCWVVYRNGVKVPYPHLLEENKKVAAAKPQSHKGKPAAKRKADDQPDGQPDSKRPNGNAGSAKADVGDETFTPLPRHIKGLLSAEDELDGEPESRAASPTPDTDAKTEVFRARKEIPDLPASASEPDKWGVRTVNKRGPKANNRLILPPPFNFDDDEIGFRDSTNDGSKKATRGTRGKFLNDPNPRHLHLDRTIVTYDCLTYGEDDLDPELVRKHNVHPKYGLFLPESRNESESPKPPVSGTRPVVVVTPNGTTLQASRSVRAYKMDMNVRLDTGRTRLASVIAEFCDKEEIPEEEVTTEEMRERKQLRHVSEQPITSAEEKAEEAEETEETDDAEQKPADEEPNAEDTNSTKNIEIDSSLARENMDRILNAASHVAAQVEAEKANQAPPSQRPSRPYDAVRDVFTNAEPTPPTSAPPVEVDTFGLSFLADVSEQVSQSQQRPPQPHFDGRLDHRPNPAAPVVEYRHDYQLEHHQPSHHEYRPDYLDLRPSHQVHQVDHRVEQVEAPSMADAMIDPRLLGPPNPPAPTHNTFLQTALNPQPAPSHMAPLPPHGTEQQAQGSIGRNPFVNSGNRKASPLLPPLRPPRQEKPIEPLLAPQPPFAQLPAEFGSSLGMMQTNSGSFFPPAPSRPFHQGYTLFEHSPLSGMPLQAGYGGMGPAHPSSHLAPSYRQAYQPPSPTMQNHPQLHPLQIPHGPSVSPPGSSMGLHSPTGPSGSRHRASMSSGSNGSNNAKYRKIAAAPIPHNRPWPASGGAELRLAHYDHREAIKDYMANEPPPRTGPTTIRGWNVNNVSKGRKSVKKDDSEEKEPPSITTYINKWNASDKSMG
ncbi:hypothetical protein GGS20DRAFT_544357 [Poronia punctata]|nr:hypothetical protein GGS20DRAFT_544357 [Poronia punctata]